MHNNLKILKIWDILDFTDRELADLGLICCRDAK